MVAEYVSLPNSQLHDGQANRLAVRFLWDLMAHQSASMRLQLPNGERIHIQPEWITPPRGGENVYPTKGLHVDLSFGTLGTGAATWAVNTVSGELVLPENALERLLARLRSGNDHPGSTQEMIKVILESHLKGRAAKKAEFRALFPGVSKRSFETAWNRTAEVRPELSRAGRKKSAR